MNDILMRSGHWFSSALLSLALTAPACIAQVPKPPWAGGADTSKKSTTAPRSDPSDSTSTIKVDVKLVNVFVTVTDQHGAPIANLNKGDFQLQEDGKLQNIAVFDKESPLPLSIVLDIDTS